MVVGHDTYQLMVVAGRRHRLLHGPVDAVRVSASTRLTTRLSRLLAPTRLRLTVALATARHRVGVGGKGRRHASLGQFLKPNDRVCQTYDDDVHDIQKQTVSFHVKSPRQITNVSDLAENIPKQNSKTINDHHLNFLEHIEVF